MQQEDAICKHMGFVIKGAARMCWAIMSVMCWGPTKAHVEMLEDTDLLIISKSR